jgi:hypothetical protein
MKNHVFLSVVRLAAGALALVAWPAGAAHASYDTGWFVEAGIRHIESSRAVSDFVVDDEETGWSLGVGYAFTGNFALQADYLDLGRDHFATDCPPPRACLVETTDLVDITGYAVSVVGRWSINELFDVYGKVGVAGWDSDFHQEPLDQSGENLLLGIGCGFNLSPHWRLALQYEDFGFDVESSTLSLSHRFGR